MPGNTRPAPGLTMATWAVAMDERIRVSRHGALLRVTLADPERRNAQLPSTWRILADIGASLDPQVRVVLLEAEGASFSAGLDRRLLAGDRVEGEPTLAEIAGGEAPDVDATIAVFQQAFTWWRTCPAITIAAVQGHAIGAGAQLMLACDLAIVADDLQFALRETSLGLVPDLAGTWPLVRRVGYHRALEICSTGRLVGADEALAIGLAERKAPAGGLAGAAAALAEEILAAPETAVRALKPLLGHAERAGYVEQQAAERAAQVPLIRAAVGEPS